MELESGLGGLPGREPIPIDSHSGSEHSVDPDRKSSTDAGGSQVGSDKVGETTTTQPPEITTAKAKTLADKCQKYVFSLPFREDTLGDKLEFKHHAFNAFFAVAAAVTAPIMLPAYSARLCYVSHMEAKELEKGKVSIEQLESSCRNLEIDIPSETKAKLDNVKAFDNSKHIVDKPFIKANNEVIKEMNTLIVDKGKAMDKELKDLQQKCKDQGLLERTADGLKLKPELGDKLTEKTRSAIEGKTQKFTYREEFALIKELKTAMGDISEPKEAPDKSNDTMIPMEMKSKSEEEPKDIKPDAEAVKPADAQPVKPLDIKPLSRGELAEFESTGNAMKDFIKCGTGFKTEEVNIGNITQKIVVKNENINAQTIAEGLGVVYPFEGKPPNATSTGVEFKELKEAMESAKGSLDPEDKSALGSLAQIDRVLDISITMLESNFYNPSIKADLNKGEDSQIRSLLNHAEEICQNHPELESLKLKKEQLEGLILKLENPNVEIGTASYEDVIIFEMGLRDIRKGKLSDDELNQFAQNMAQDSGDIFMSLFKNVDCREFLKSGQGFDKVADFQSKLSLSIVENIFKGKNKDEIGRSIEFYTKVVQAAIDKGDYMTAFTVYQGLQNSSLTRLYETAPVYIKLNEETKNNLEKYNNLLTAMYNFRELRQAEKDFKAKGGIPIPLITINAKDSTMYGEGSQKDLDVPTKGFKIPNSALISGISSAVKSFGDINKLEGGSANACKGFKSVLEYQNVQSESRIDRERDLNALFTNRSLQLKPKPGARPRTFGISGRKTV